MAACVIIPARHASTRFPGKPLVGLLGRPMLQWVCELSARAVGAEHVYVATDDDRIVEAVGGFGATPIMTGPALTGTDRLAEAVRDLDYDIVVNVQGDEPLVDPDDIAKCIALKRENPGKVINAWCWIGPNEDPATRDIPKLVINEAGSLIYMSRLPIPGFKDGAKAPIRYRKQVCIYGFDRKQLMAFSSFGRKGEFEEAEDIEILRFLELGIPVQMFETHGTSLAVDRPQDVPGVEAALRARMGD